MSLLITAEPMPLATDADGVVRVGSTRVTLDTVVSAYMDGMTPEGIVEQYPSLQVAQVYSVIGYFLNHRSEVDAYLRERQQRREEVRKENESRFNPVGIRDRLLARRHKFV